MPPINPPPPRPAQTLAFAALGLMAFLGWMAFQRETTPTAAFGTSVSTSGETQPVAVSPIPAVFLEAAAAFATSLAPTPMPATPTAEPTYDFQPTPLPLLCGAWVTIGEECQMPAPTATPTPTPPNCPTTPETMCVWRGTPTSG